MAGKPTHAILHDAGRVKAAITILESLDSSPEARRAGQAAASDLNATLLTELLNGGREKGPSDGG